MTIELEETWVYWHNLAIVLLAIAATIAILVALTVATWPHAGQNDVSPMSREHVQNSVLKSRP